jgi:hypothetical protein
MEKSNVIIAILDSRRTKRSFKQRSEDCLFLIFPWFVVICQRVYSIIVVANHTNRSARNIAEDVNVILLLLRCSVSAVECSSEPVHIM